jgi:hypothetical protein
MGQLNPAPGVVGTGTTWVGVGTGGRWPMAGNRIYQAAKTLIKDDDRLEIHPRKHSPGALRSPDWLR